MFVLSHNKSAEARSSVSVCRDCTRDISGCEILSFPPLINWMWDSFPSWKESGSVCADSNYFSVSSLNDVKHRHFLDPLLLCSERSEPSHGILETPNFKCPAAVTSVPDDQIDSLKKTEICLIWVDVKAADLLVKPDDEVTFSVIIGSISLIWTEVVMRMMDARQRERGPGDVALLPSVGKKIISTCQNYNKY